MTDKKTSRFYKIVFDICLCFYVLAGIKSDLLFTASRSISENLMEDFGYYERALDDALAGTSPYEVQIIGLAYLYPPPALLVVETFHSITPFYLKYLIYTACNIALLLCMLTGIAKHYGISRRNIWYWYILCLGSAPLFEALYMGQINVITLFGVFLLFYWLDVSPALSGFGLSLAILTKVSPLIFLAYLAATKKFKVIAATGVWITILLVISIFRYGIGPVLEYPTFLRSLSGYFQVSYNSQSLVSKLAMLSAGVIQPAQYQSIQNILMLYLFIVILASSLLTLVGKQSKEPLFIISALAMTILPNVMWYHHYVFLLLPLLVWMGWKQLDLRVVTWCLAWLIIIQADRILTYGLLTHILAHISILYLLFGQARQFRAERTPAVFSIQNGLIS